MIKLQVVYPGWSLWKSSKVHLDGGIRFEYQIFDDFSSEQSCLKIILSNWQYVLLNLCRTHETSRKRKLQMKEWIWKSKSKEIEEEIRSMFRYLIDYYFLCDWFFFGSVNLIWRWHSMPSNSQQDTCLSSSRYRVLLKALIEDFSLTLTPMSDQDRISHHNIITISRKQMMRTKNKKRTMKNHSWP